MSAIEDQIRRMINEVLDERQPAMERAQPPPPVAELVDEKTRAEVNEFIRVSHKPYLTRKESAIYLGVSPRSIAEWAARPSDQNPFPESSAGGEPRVKRERIDEWAERERGRQRLKLAG